MSQNWTENSYEAGHVGQTDLQNKENNFACLKSAFSGVSGPSNPVAGMPWYYTTKKIPRFRDSGNANWLCLLPGDINQKIWIYRNDTVEGMVVDSSITDRVLAIKGGSQAYNVNGGNPGGTWTQPNHTLTTSQLPAHTHPGTTNSDGTHNHDVNYNPGSSGFAFEYSGGDVSWNTTPIQSAGAHTHTFTSGSTGSGSAHNHGTTHRPAAAVGTLQKPDL